MEGGREGLGWVAVTWFVSKMAHHSLCIFMNRAHRALNKEYYRMSFWTQPWLWLDGRWDRLGAVAMTFSLTPHC